MDTSDACSTRSPSPSASSEGSESSSSLSSLCRKWNARIKIGSSNLECEDDDNPNTSYRSDDTSDTLIAANDHTINQNPSNEHSDMQPGPSTSRAPSITRQNSSNIDTSISKLLNSEIPSRRFPDKYVLYCFDKKLIPKCIKDRYKTANIPSSLKKSSIYLWIKPSVFASTKIKVKSGKDNEQAYYIVRIETTRTMLPSEFITALYFDEDVSAYETRENLMGSILVIPLKDPDLAMIYCFGNVTSIINKFGIVKHFGLKITASKDICRDPYRIKELMVETPYDYNRKTKTTKTRELETIEVFTPATGAEFFRMMRVKPDGVKRLVKGSDRFEFPLSLPKKAPTTSHKACLAAFTHTLIKISKELYKIYKKDKIHIEYEDFIAKEIEDTDTKNELNNRLVTILKKDRTSYDNHYLFLNPEVFHWGLGTQLEYRADNVNGNFGNSGKFLDALHDTMQQPNAGLESTIKITNNKKMAETEYVFALLIANAVEYNGHFYHFVFGSWFSIPESRYNFLKTAIERKKMEYRDLGLIAYTKDHDTTIDNNGKKKKDYQELRYNTDAVNKLNQSPISELRAILLDRLTIVWPIRTTKKEQFEFADIFITDNRKIQQNNELYYILHVKRKTVKNFEKQCNQVIRCAEFLCKVLTNKLYISLMLQGCINGLYRSHGLASIRTYVSSDNKLTHGETIKVGDNNWQTKVINAIKLNTRKDQTDFHTGMHNMADEFFKTYEILNKKKHKRECLSAINAIFDCYENDKNLTFEEAQNFFETVEFFIGVADQLLGKSKLNKATRKKTHIIFAFIADKPEPVKIDPVSQRPNYFTHNELLGLELALHKVEGLGFQFGWTWIENDFKVTKKSTSKGKKSQTSQKPQNGEMKKK